MARIAIVGAGYMGTAVAWPLSDNGHEVRLVGTHLDGEIIGSCKQNRFHPKLRRELPKGVEPYFVEQIDEAMESADLIVSGVNSLGVRWMGATLGPRVQPGAKIIAVTKGLEASPEGEARVLPDVLRDALPEGVTLAAVGGPCIAGELAGRRQSCVVFASRDGTALPWLRGLFETDYYHVWTSTDLVGVEVCTALKNAFVVAIGMADGMLDAAGGADEAGAVMHNPASALFAEAATEMARVVALMGGRVENVTGLPGVGDQFVTARGGRTAKLGRLLGRGLTYEQARSEMAGETLEGAYVVQQLARAIPVWEVRGIIDRDDLPLLRALVEVIAEGRRAEIPWRSFFGGGVA